MSNSKTFVLQEIIDNLVNSQITLIDPLTKLNYFGLLIKNEELIQYTLHELNGYNKASELPAYRKRFGRLIVDLVDDNFRYNRELPLSLLDEPFKSSLQYLTVKEGIGTVEQFVKAFQNNESNNQLIHPLPLEALPHFLPAVRKLYPYNNLVGAMLTAPPHIMIDILNSVRTKLLALVMDVGEKFGFQIEIDSFIKNRDLNNQTINNYMKTEITNTGDGNVVNTGDNSSLAVTTTITKGDVSQLDNALTEYGIDAGDIGELKEIIKVEEPDYDHKKLGTKTNTWIGGIVGKSLNGVGKIATTITGNILATLIKSFYGIHD